MTELEKKELRIKVFGREYPETVNPWTKEDFDYVDKVAAHAGKNSRYTVTILDTLNYIRETDPDLVRHLEKAISICIDYVKHPNRLWTPDNPCATLLRRDDINDVQRSTFYTVLCDWLACGEESIK